MLLTYDHLPVFFFLPWARLILYLILDHAMIMILSQHHQDVRRREIRRVDYGSCRLCVLWTCWFPRLQCHTSACSQSWLVGVLKIIIRTFAADGNCAGIDYHPYRSRMMWACWSPRLQCHASACSQSWLVGSPRSGHSRSVYHHQTFAADGNYAGSTSIPSVSYMHAVSLLMSATPVLSFSMLAKLADGRPPHLRPFVGCQWTRRVAGRSGTVSAAVTSQSHSSVHWPEEILPTAHHWWHTTPSWRPRLRKLPCSTRCTFRKKDNK